MRVRIIAEHGLVPALFGLSLSHGQHKKLSSDEELLAKMRPVADRLAYKGDGHNKFLESIVVWVDIKAPRYWWQEFDTYRVGVTKQSESTMHTITDEEITNSMFEYSLPLSYIAHLERLRQGGDWERLKVALPESFLQRRIVCTNYMALQRMIRQRLTHRLPQWRLFCDSILHDAEHPEWLLSKPPVQDASER